MYRAALWWWTIGSHSGVKVISAANSRDDTVPEKNSAGSDPE